MPHLLGFLSTSSTSTSLGSLFPCLTTLSVMNIFLISNLNLPCAISGCLGEDPDPHLNTTCFEVVVESNKVSPGPSFPATSLLEQKRRELRTGGALGG